MPDPTSFKLDDPHDFLVSLLVTLPLGLKMKENLLSHSFLSTTRTALTNEQRILR